MNEYLEPISQNELNDALEGTSRPAHIKENHWREWVEESKVDPSITALNVRSLSGTLPHEYLLYGLPDGERRNDGRLRDKWLYTYQHLEDGGWWCSGLDLIKKEESSWGCFKPDRRRKNEKGKPIKYEHPPKVPTEAFFLKITWEVGLKIAKRYDCEEAFRESFPVRGAINIWEFVRVRPEISIILTEGVKKAASLLSAGYCAIALPGIYNGYRQKKDGFGYALGLPHLIPQLEIFALKGRSIYFCFDNDPKPKTRRAVRTATLKTGKLFQYKGCQVWVILWDGHEKGVDELIVNRGTEYFDAAYNSRRGLADYKLNEVLDLSPFVNLTVKERYLPDGLVPPDTAQLIGIKSWQGTGKTEYLARKIKPLLDKGQNVIVIVHREQLAISLAHRFGIDYRTEIHKSETKGIFGYALCIDSLHGRANPKFNPRDWEEAYVIIDEVEQVIRHLLLGSTCFNNRVAILKTFKELLNVVISTGGKIYLADADLSPISIKYILELIDRPVETWVVENTFVPNEGKRKIYIYNDETALIQKAYDAVNRGKTILFHTDGRKHKTTWGTRNLEHVFKKKYPHLKILRIDQDSVSDPSNPAYGCMGDINAALLNYDIVFASPTVETGVSIDEYIFDEVYCLSHGVQAVDSVCQAIERYRLDVDRHIYIQKYSPSKIGNGSIDIRALLAGEHGNAKANINFLIKAGFNELATIEDDLSLTPSLLAYAKIACVINNQSSNFKEQVLIKLEKMGYEIIPVSEEKNTNLKAEIIESKTELYDGYCGGVEGQENPTDSEYEKLQTQSVKSESDRLKEHKGKLCRRYLTEKITKELVKKDDEGWYQKISLHFYFDRGNHLLAERDRKILSKLLEFGDGQLFKPDLNKSLLASQIHALNILQIKQFFDPDAEFTGDGLREWYEKINNPTTRSQIKLIFGFTINPDKDTPIAVAQRFLGLMGLKLEFSRWQRENGKAKRIYKGCALDPDERGPVFERWLDERSIPIKDGGRVSVTGGV